MANVDLPEEEEEACAALSAQRWSRSTSIANDTFAVLRAGAASLDGGGEPWGVAVTCGAGINCVGLAPDGRSTRYLALGDISGDWGGGSDLGSQALWWAIRAEDGRGEPTALREAVAGHFGVATVREVTLGLHKGLIADDELLGLTSVLFAAAHRGDRVARSLISRQADEICLMALTAMRRLGLLELATPVILGGGLITARDPLLLGGITDRLAREAPLATSHVIDIPPVAGAALLGLDHVHATPAAKSALRATYSGPARRLTALRAE
jgi:N-acetylglucosamine kinase-like BadF-type ATPase